MEFRPSVIKSQIKLTVVSLFIITTRFYICSAMYKILLLFRLIGK
jgi:hypothetical protein